MVREEILYMKDVIAWKSKNCIKISLELVSVQFNATHILQRRRPETEVLHKKQKMKDSFVLFHL